VEDLSDFQAYRTDPLVARFQGWNIISDAEARTFLEEMHACPLLVPGAWSQIGIAEAASDRLIGDIGVRVAADGSEAELGISLALSSQGLGLAVESLRATLALLWEHTQVPRVVARCDTRNGAALRLMGRLGFTLEGDRPVMVHGEACVDRAFVLPLARPR
jgi:RimJ/RimL family protein N-acetyltransferase